MWRAKSEIAEWYVKNQPEWYVNLARESYQPDLLTDAGYCESHCWISGEKERHDILQFKADGCYPLPNGGLMKGKTNLNIHHIVPKRVGGTNDIDNLMIVHRELHKECPHGGVNLPIFAEWALNKAREIQDVWNEWMLRPLCNGNLEITGYQLDSFFDWVERNKDDEVYTEELVAMPMFYNAIPGIITNLEAVIPDYYASLFKMAA